MSNEPRNGNWPNRPVMALLILALLLGAALRLYHLGEQSLWYDEGASLFLRHLVDSHLTILHPSANNEPPMNAVLTRVWYGLVRTLTQYPVISEQNDFLIRLLPGLCAIASLPLIFLVGRRILGGDWAALFATFLFAVSPFQIYYAQELRIYAFYVLIGLLTLWAMIDALERDRWWAWALMTLGMTVMMYSHYVSVWNIFALNLFFVCSVWAYRRLFWKWVAANAAMMALILPAIYLAWRFNKVLLTVKYAWYPELTWKTGLITFKNFFAGYGPAAWAYWPLFLMAAALFVLGLWSLRRRWPMAVLLAAVAVVPIAANVAMWTHRPFSFYEHRLFIFSAVAATWAIAQGIHALKRPVLMTIALALLTAFTLPGLRDYYAHRLHPIEIHRLAVYDKVDFRSAAAHIQANLEPGDLVGHANHFMVYPMKHYLSANQVRLGMSEVDEQIFIDGFGNVPLLQRHDLMPVPIEQATREARRVWFTESYGFTFEYKPLTDPIRAWLDTHWTQVERHTFNGLYVTLYQRKGEAG